MDEIILNKVAQSEIETIDLEKYFPEGETTLFDLKEFLFMELILKEGLNFFTRSENFCAFEYPFQNVFAFILASFER